MFGLCDREWLGDDVLKIFIEIDCRVWVVVIREIKIIGGIVGISKNELTFRSL